MSKPHRNHKFHRGWVGKFSTGGGNVWDTLGGWRGCGRGDKRTNERTDKQMDIDVAQSPAMLPTCNCSWECCLTVRPKWSRILYIYNFISPNMW